MPSNVLNAWFVEVTRHLEGDAVNCLKPRTHQEIPALTKQVEADLVVIGTVGHTGVPSFITPVTLED